MENSGIKVAGAVVISAAVLIGAYFAFVGSDDVETNSDVSVTTQTESSANETSQLAPESEQLVESTIAHVDGTYTADTTYPVPSGDNESVSVTLTLVGDSITDLQVETVSTHPTSERYQSQFDEAINDEVDGTDIDEADVSRVGGASLTSSAFNDILEAIREQSAQS